MKLYYEFNPNLNYNRENLRWNGWGSYEEDYVGKEHIPEILNFLRNELKLESNLHFPFPSLEEIQLTKSRMTSPDEKFFQNLCGKDGYKNSRLERVLHSLGRSYWDMVRLQWNQISHFVDGVLYPRNLKEIQKALEYCKKNKIAVIPYGGGSSVVGGLEAIKKKEHKAVLSLDMSRLSELIKIDENNLTAKFQAGIYGPKLEAKLNEYGYTLGHFPQSFVYSTLGGWVACRSAGQQSNRYGKMEEMVTQLQIVTPEGKIETGDYPSHAAGPDWKELILGSEGLFGVITEVSVRIQPLPEKRLYYGILLKNFQDGKELIRMINQEGIPTAMLRLSDEEESRLFSELSRISKKKWYSPIKNTIQNQILKLYGFYPNYCVLLVGLEGSEEETLESYLEIRKISSQFKTFYVGESIGKKWIQNRFNMPFLRNHIMEYGIGVDTMETSAPYHKLEEIRNDFHKSIKSSIPHSLSMCHISHSYVNGSSLYFTVIFPIQYKNPLGQWQKLKKIASDCFFKHGASASHHHGIGLDHQSWYEKEFPAYAVQSLQSLKKSLDPTEILNPGKLFHKIK